MPRVTSKGQVTIPVGVRERLGIEAGTEVEFEVSDGAALLRKKHPHDDWRAYLERIRGTASSGLTTDEIMAMTRGED